MCVKYNAVHMGAVNISNSIWYVLLVYNRYKQVRKFKSPGASPPLSYNIQNLQKKQNKNIFETRNNVLLVLKNGLYWIHLLDKENQHDCIFVEY